VILPTKNSLNVCSLVPTAYLDDIHGHQVLENVIRSNQCRVLGDIFKKYKVSRPTPDTYYGDVTSVSLSVYVFSEEELIDLLSQAMLEGANNKYMGFQL
jgi:hypothetical protein